MDQSLGYEVDKAHDSGELKSTFLDSGGPLNRKS